MFRKKESGGPQAVQVARGVILVGFMNAYEQGRRSGDSGAVPYEEGL